MDLLYPFPLYVYLTQQYIFFLIVGVIVSVMTAIICVYMTSLLLFSTFSLICYFLLFCYFSRTVCSFWIGGYDYFDPSEWGHGQQNQTTPD